MARSEHHPSGLIHYNPELAFRGYTLFTANRDFAFLIDMEGRIVHRWKSDRGIKNARLLPDGNLIAHTGPSPDVEGQRGLNGQAAACFEMDWDGNIIWEYVDPWQHHDYERLPNGNTLIIKWGQIPSELVGRIQGGYHAEDDDQSKMLGDLVIEVGPDGTLVRQWQAWEHFDPETELICPIDHRREWTHCNSISLSPDGNWLMSFRVTSMVALVDSGTGEIIWKWADGTTAHQHDAKYTEAGTITIFDNGVHRRGLEYSRVLEVDAETRKTVWEYADDPPFAFYSFMASSTDRLPNGNTFICEASKGHLFEVTMSKKVVWEYINPFFVPNARFGGRTNSIPRAHRYGPDDPALADRDLDPDRFRNLNRLYS